MTTVRRLLAFGMVAAAATCLAASDATNYYRKWLEEDVYWIIIDQERDVFSKLKTDEERDAFIEQFWLRRDPDPATSENEFKIEHYRRILYANENFTAGIALAVSGGTVFAGGGFTSIFPIERWEYRHIEGVGDDVELEFVDDKGGGLFELTFDKQRKDALLLSGLMGLTQDELEAGVTNKQDRIARRRYSGEWKGVYSGMGGFESHKDKPLAQLGISAGLNRAPAVKYKDLEAAVSARISYTGFPFDLRQDFIRLTDQEVLVPITVSLANETMSFTNTVGIYHGGVEIFGRVVGLGNRIEAVFEDEVVRDFAPEEFDDARSRHSIYQKRLILKPGLYKIDVAIKDLVTKRIGAIERRLEVPRFAEGKLQTSSLLLAASIEQGTAERAGSNFIFHGSGFGHGLGLCQEGAHVMAQRGANYQRILQKYFPGTNVRPRSGNVSLARPFKAGNNEEENQFVASAMVDFFDQPSLTRRAAWHADLIPALKGRAKLTRRYAAVSLSAARFFTISSEHFRVTYPAGVARREADQVLNNLESARADFSHRAANASISIGELPALEIRFNESTGDFTSRTGQPWWAAAATRRNRIELQPLAILQRRGVLTSTLRHELAHAVIDVISHNRAPRWLEEGFAIYLAGEGRLYSHNVPRGVLSNEELEKRLVRPTSQQEMRALYAQAYRSVANTVRQAGESGVWKKLAAA